MLTFYDDPKGVLFKLTQHGSINEYLHELERLTIRIIGMLPSFLLSCFISGLTSKLCREVQVLQPVSFPQAISLAKLQEDKLEDRCRGYRPRTQAPTTIPNPIYTPLLPSSINTPSPPTRPQVCHLTSKEIAHKREHGLCYNCDEKWALSHKCKARFFLLVVEEDDPGPDNPTSHLLNLTPPPTIPTTQPTTPTQISFNTLSGTSTPEALKLFGFIHNFRMTVLIDDGSTHNFI